MSVYGGGGHYLIVITTYVTYDDMTMEEFDKVPLIFAIIVDASKYTTNI